MNELSQKLTTWMLISIFGIACSVLSGGRILCIGDSGHSKIEQQVESCCTLETSTQPAVAVSSTNHKDDECGDCNDIDVSTLLSSNVNVRSSYDSTPAHFAATCYISSKLLIPNSTYGKNDNSISFNPTLSKLAVTTTVLIC